MNIVELTQKILGRKDPEHAAVPIVQAGHPALRRRALPVEESFPSEVLADLVATMVVTMRRAPGVGLAAPQIGIPLQVAVLEDPWGSAPGEDRDNDLYERRELPLRFLINPRYEEIGSEAVFGFEGCLSVEGFASIVPRSRRVLVQALELTADGSIEQIDQEFTGWPARIMQHEIDHLHGTLCHDRAVPRSYIEAGYQERYTVHSAIDRLGLSGEITQLDPGSVMLDRAAARDNVE